MTKGERFISGFLMVLCIVLTLSTFVLLGIAVFDTAPLSVSTDNGGWGALSDYFMLAVVTGVGAFLSGAAYVAFLEDQ